MTVWSHDLAALQRAEPTPLLTHLAGEHAARLAGLWPAPHTDFITATADRRHLVCFVLSQPEERVDRFGAAALLEQPVRVLIRDLGEAAPAGLARALTRLGEVAWSADDYRGLALGLRTFGVSARLRHAEAITPAHLAVLRAVPAELRDVGLCSPSITPAQAELLTEIYRALAARDGRPAALAQGRAWSGASSAADMLQRAKTSLNAPTATPPFPGSERLRPFDTAEALLDAARRYRNCLTNYLDEASAGASAFYEWTGDPGAVVGLERDPLFGWRLDQARAVDNAPVDEPARSAIVAELRSWGVHVGRSQWDLRNALDRACKANFQLESLETCIGDMFGD